MSLIAASTLADIVRVVWSSILASVLVACAFSAGIVGLMRAAELRREDRSAAAAACTAAALLALTVCMAAVVYGVILVGQKS